MTFKMSDNVQTITIYNLRADTNEFIGAGEAYIPPHTGLPANSTDIEPPEVKAEQVAVFDVKNNMWSIVEDHRGKTVYETETGAPKYISELGLLPENVTVESPTGDFQKWDGTAWVKDEEAEKAALTLLAEENKKQLMQVADEQIAILQDAVDLEIATEKELSDLIEWRKYRVLLNRTDADKAEDIERPKEQ